MNIEYKCPLYNQDGCYKAEIDCTCNTCPKNKTKSKVENRRYDMLTIKDRIEQFKRDCKSNDYYTKAILDCNERIEELDVQLTGLGCPNGADGPKCENAGNPYASNKLGPIMLQDQIIEERNGYIKKLNYVNGMLMKILNPVDRQMIADLFIEKKYYKNMIEKYHFSDASSMYRHANKVIGKIV